jgi:hypothetical protein
MLLPDLLPFAWFFVWLFVCFNDTSLDLKQEKSLKISWKHLTAQQKE